MTDNMSAYQAGQRDREQGWPDHSYYWKYTGEQLVAYHAGYANPRRVLHDPATTDATILLRLRVQYTRPIPSMADAALLNAALHLEQRQVDHRSGCGL